MMLWMTKPKSLNSIVDVCHFHAWEAMMKLLTHIPLFVIPTKEKFAALIISCLLRHS